MEPITKQNIGETTGILITPSLNIVRMKKLRAGLFWAKYFLYFM